MDTPIYNKYITNKVPNDKTQRLINRIKEVENFENLAFLCEDFDTFIDEVAEWGVDSIAKVDFDDPEVNRGMMNAFFASFVAPSNPHPAGGTHNVNTTSRRHAITNL